MSITLPQFHKDAADELAIQIHMVERPEIATDHL
jgi:hypothetical protein